MVTFLLSSSGTKTCDLSFTWFSIWWSRKSLNCQFLFKGTLWLAARGRNWPFALFAWNLKPPYIIFLTFPILLKFSKHLNVVMEAEGIFWCQVWKLVVDVVVDCTWVYHVPHWTFLAWKGRNILNLVWIYDKSLCSPCEKLANFKNLNTYSYVLQF